jgi:hypothetical protein
LEYYLKKLKMEVSEEVFKKCVVLVDKIITNIISNPKEEKYFRIKKV